MRFGLFYEQCLTQTPLDKFGLDCVEAKRGLRRNNNKLEEASRSADMA